MAFVLFTYDITVAVILFAIILVNNLVFIYRLAKRDSLKRGKHTNIKVEELKKEIQRLKNESAKYNNPDQFVTHSKIERQIIPKQKELDKIASENNNRGDGSANDNVLSWLPPIFIKYVVTLLLVFIFYSTPILVIPKIEEKGILYYLVWPFSLPSWSIGTIAPIPYITIMNQIVHFMVKPLRSVLAKLRSKEKPQ